ncbi:transporter, partial [Perkinsus olseni]
AISKRRPRCAALSERIYSASPSSRSEPKSLRDDTWGVLTDAKVDWLLLIQMSGFGVIALLPFNLALTELDFLNGSFQHDYAAVLSFLDSISVNIVQILLIWYGNRFSFKPRINLGCLLMAAGTLLTAVIAMVVDNSIIAFLLALICVSAMGVGYAVLEQTALGVAAMCPPSCTLSIMV